MKTKSIILSIMLLLTMGMMSTSCVSQKKLVYFQGADSIYAKAQGIHHIQYRQIALSQGNSNTILNDV